MELLIKGATILTCDPLAPDLFDGELLIVDGRIERMSAEPTLAGATLHAAEACWQGDVTGSLASGKSADLVILRPQNAPRTVDEAYAQVVWFGHASSIESVLIEGQPDAAVAR